MNINWTGVGQGAADTVSFFVKVGLVLLSYSLAKSVQIEAKSKNTNDLIIRILKTIGICAFIGFMVSSEIGTHTEDCDGDALYGSCSTVTDYVPTAEKQAKAFTTTGLLFLLPALAGLFATKTEKENKKS